MSEPKYLEDFKRSICDEEYQPPKSNAATTPHKVLHHLSREMLDKILRHRQAIEAHLAFDEEAGNGGRGDLRPKIDLEDNKLILTAQNANDLRKANQVLEHILSSPKGDLGLTGLTSEALLAKMSRETKLPLGSASSWDPAVRRKKDMEEAKKLLMNSNLPPELSFAPQPTLEDWLVVPRHANVTRAASDSYVKYMNRMVITDNNRRKLESEDSSYGSDHEHQLHHGAWTGGHANVELHEDISRTASETLAAEYEDDLEAIEATSALIKDKSYEAKVVKALKLGYTEAQLQRAVIKLGPKASVDQILEELIRIEKSAKPVDPFEDQNKVAIPKNELYKEMIEDSENTLLPIVIDGSNVAMSHGNKIIFSCKGIKICVDWFRKRGHDKITVFVPLWRKESSKPESPIRDQYILEELEREQILSFTPSRQVAGKRFIPHDDRFVLNLATEVGGIVVSNDQFKEFANDKKFKEVIEERILMYTFVNDIFMPPDDPFGRNGPTLEQFLRKKTKVSTQQPCPYGKKCTYGNKCKYWHPDRANNQKSITEQLKANSSQRISKVLARNSRDSSPGDSLIRTKSMQPKAQPSKQTVMRTQSSVPTLDWSHCPPPVDTSMPPPPPRTPWVAEPQNRGHARLSRQLSVNPNYDPRIHQSVQQPKPSQPDYSRPPPPVPRHIAVSRNASAPENQALYPQKQVYVEQPFVSNSDSQLHKTWSSPPPESNPVGVAAAASTSAMSPLVAFPGSSGIWDSQPQIDREKLYFHLASIFPEDRVRLAMKALPGETDATVICQHICQHIDGVQN